MNKKYEITAGSIADIMQKENATLAESFLTCDAIILFDVSGSMHDCDGTPLSRFDRGVRELRDLQSSLPGRVAIVQFSDSVEFMPGGVPVLTGGSTNLTAALKYIRIADSIPDMRFIIISDGEPNNEISAMQEAQTFSNRIDTIFIGDETDPVGRTFLKRLAAASGGSPVTAAAETIKAQVETLLLCERN